MTSSNPYKTKVTRTALAIVTDLYNRPDGVVGDFADTELARTVEDNELEDSDMVIGLINIVTYLLVLFEKEGHDPNTVLAHIGAKLAAD